MLKGLNLWDPFEEYLETLENNKIVSLTFYINVYFYFSTTLALHIECQYTPIITAK